MGSLLRSIVRWVAMSTWPPQPHTSVRQANESGKGRCSGAWRRVRRGRRRRRDGGEGVECIEIVKSDIGNFLYALKIRWRESEEARGFTDEGERGGGRGEGRAMTRISGPVPT